MKTFAAAAALLATAAAPCGCQPHGAGANVAQAHSATAPASVTKPAAKPRLGWHVYAIGVDYTGPETTYNVTCLPNSADDYHADPKQFREVQITHAQYRKFVANPTTFSIPCPG